MVASYGCVVIDEMILIEGHHLATGRERRVANVGWRTLAVSNRGHPGVSDVGPVYGSRNAHLGKFRRRCPNRCGKCYKVVYDFNSACCQFATPLTRMNARCLFTIFNCSEY